MGSPYDDRFFAGQRAGSRSSADAILPAIIEAVGAKSVVDVGCGVGTWLAAARALGVEDLLGFDGHWVDRSTIEIPDECFVATDLRNPLGRPSRRFDLAISMETAEHLPAERAASLVSDLVALAPVVLFSAAIPGQGGTDHVNEQWMDYWEAHFADHGYRRIDAVRWNHWGDERVEECYTQNSQIYAAEGCAVPLAAPEGIPLRIVHPRTLTGRLEPWYVSRELTYKAIRWHAHLAWGWYVRRPLRSIGRRLRPGR